MTLRAPERRSRTLRVARSFIREISCRLPVRRIVALLELRLIINRLMLHRPLGGPAYLPLDNRSQYSAGMAKRPEKNRAAQELARMRWLGVSAKARTAHGKKTVSAREKKRAERRSETEKRLTANIKAGLLEAEHRRKQLKISNAYYKFGYLYLYQLGVDRAKLAAWNGRSVSKSLRSMLADATLIDLIPAGQKLSFMRGLTNRASQGSRGVP